MPEVQISLDEVNIFLGHAHYTTIAMNDADVRDFAEAPEGAVSFADFSGKPKYEYITTEGDETWWFASSVYGGEAMLLKYHGSTIYNDGHVGAFTETSVVVGSYTYLRGGIVIHDQPDEDHIYNTYTITRYLT